MYIQTKDLKKSYGEGGSFSQVLKGVNIGVEKGEMCVIQGRHKRLGKIHAP